MIPVKRSIIPDFSRGATVRIRVSKNSEDRFVFRRSLRGGALGRLLGSNYVGNQTRMFHELALTAYASQLGIPTAEIVIASRESLAPFLYRGWVLTKEVRNSQNLHSYLATLSNNPTPEECKERRAVISTLAALIKKMHNLGIYHGDLHIGNILIQVSPGKRPCIHMIDFDKSSLIQPMALSKRTANLMRLYRSIIKRPELFEKLTHSDMERFLCVYFEGNRKARRSSEPFFRKFLRVIRLHRLRWNVSGQFRKANFRWTGGPIRFFAGMVSIAKRIPLFNGRKGDR